LDVGTGPAHSGWVLRLCTGRRFAAALLGVRRTRRRSSPRRRCGLSCLGSRRILSRSCPSSKSKNFVPRGKDPLRWAPWVSPP